jgi:penicillin-binding protein 2
LPNFYSAARDIGNFLVSQRIAQCIALWVIIVALIAACGTQPAALNEGGTEPSPQPLLAATLPLSDAQQVASEFLTAWERDDYDTMYSLITVNSRDAYDRDDFERRYRDAERIMALVNDVVQSGEPAKSHSLAAAIHLGNESEIAYDMTFHSGMVGTFTDSNRVLRLVTTPEGWRVAWTPGDIIAELRDGAVLALQQTRPNRGNIYDRSGRAIADQNGSLIRVTMYTRAYPTDDPEACYRQIASVFKLRTIEQMRELFTPRNGEDYAYVIGEVAESVFVEEQAALERVCTITFERLPMRRYVAGGLAPHIVGYVGRIPAENADFWLSRGYPADALVGLDGIELYWEETLAGKGAASLVVLSRGVPIRTLASSPAVPSQSVYLTLDRDLQEAVQDSLREAFEQSAWGTWSPGGSIIIMDVNTGEILAIASYPDFDVEAFNPYSSYPDAQQMITDWQSDPRKPTFNRATLGQYPAGSIFKIVSMIAAVDSGVFNLNTPYSCYGTWNGTPLGDRVRNDWKPGGHGTVNFSQALMGSCNPYFWHVGWTLDGVDPYILTDYAQRMGFGAKTGSQDVNEATGSLPDPNNHERLRGIPWTRSDALNTVIGQGEVLVTPLQFVRAVAAVANGGTLYQPLLVKQVGIIGAEPSYVAEPIPNGELGIDPAVLEGVQDAMCGVVTNPLYGTAKFVFDGLEGVTVCGKTGTAQAGFEDDLPHAWFVAYAGRTPDQPEIAVVGMAEYAGEGSEVAAPLVRRAIEIYYDLPTTPYSASSDAASNAGN